MKKLILTLALLFTTSIVSAADITIPTSTSNTIVMEINNDADVTAFIFDFNRMPTSCICMDVNKILFMNETSLVDNSVINRGIIYGLDQTPIISGEIAQFTFEDITYGTVPITISNVQAVNGEAIEISVEVVDGVIAITFSEEQVGSMVDSILEKTAPMGMDLNNDGVEDMIDLQLMVNNLE